MGLAMQKEKSTYSLAHSTVLCKYLGCCCLCVVRVPLTQDILPLQQIAGYLLGITPEEESSVR